MAFLDFLNPGLDFILEPLLKLSPFWAILILSLIMSLIVTLVYKYATDQTKMKQLREEVKHSQTKIKEHKDNPEKVIEIQKQAMNANLELMKASFKPTLITLLPILIIFGWVNSHFMYDPLLPNTPFGLEVKTSEGIQGTTNLELPQGFTADTLEQTITNNKATYNIQGPEGEYLLKLLVNNQTYEKQVLITTKRESLEPTKIIKDKNIEEINLGYQQTIVMNLLGWNLGWIGAYIVWSIVFSMGLRKVLKVV